MTDHSPNSSAIDRMKAVSAAWDEVLRYYQAAEWEHRQACDRENRWDSAKIENNSSGQTRANV
ncbi:MAG: hypothetical protein LC676_14805 [Loktanella sp.]|nr:hypothetical protein [Loktanella sp.]